jgi:hypothetical protein
MRSLADSGTVTLTLSSPGAQTIPLPVALTPSAVVFNGVDGPIDLSAHGTPRSFGVQLQTLDLTTMRPSSCCQTPRPGWSRAVVITSSDPSVVTVSPDAIQLSGAGAPSVAIKPGNPGKAVVTLSVPPFTNTAASGQEIVVNVQ